VEREASSWATSIEEIEMSPAESLQRAITVPPQVTVEVDGRNVRVKGPLGVLQDDLSHLPVTITVKDSVVEIVTLWPRKREAGMLGTAAAHVRNMIRGVNEGYKYSLRTVYAHFPVTVKMEEKARVLRIENFTGEKTPRFAKVLDGVKVTVRGEDVIVEGTNLNAVSQTAANVQNATRIKKKDQRVFLDGIYVFHKGNLSQGAGP
jgi:large subunit ribosomal protein L6